LSTRRQLRCSRDEDRNVVRRSDDPDDSFYPELEALCRETPSTRTSGWIKEAPVDGLLLLAIYPDNAKKISGWTHSFAQTEGLDVELADLVSALSSSTSVQKRS